MAQGDKEHRMVFDIRGRRGVAIKVVYAILALLMVASLFLVTGAINLNTLFGGNSGGESASSQLEKQSASIEAKLAKSPEDEDLLAALTRTRLSTATAMINEGVSSQGDVEEVKQQLAKGSEDWSKYLEAASEPSPGLATQVAPAIFQLAEISSSTGEALENVKAATEAQEIVAEGRPSLNSYSTLAFYKLFTQDYKGAEEFKEKAVEKTHGKIERETFENKYKEIEENAKEVGKQLKLEKAEKATNGGGEGGKETLENPLSGLGGPTLGE
jgi:hypothetical protein